MVFATTVSVKAGRHETPDATAYERAETLIA